MGEDRTRREFLAAAGALAAAAIGTPAEGAERRARPPAEGRVIVFQGDSITDCGRNRNAAEANLPAALGVGYPFLAAAAALAKAPEAGLRFYNRGVSGDKVPDLAARWSADTLDLKPDILSVLVGVNDFWHRLLRGYTGTVKDANNQAYNPDTHALMSYAPTGLGLSFVTPPTAWFIRTYHPTGVV